MEPIKRIPHRPSKSRPSKCKSSNKYPSLLSSVIAFLFIIFLSGINNAQAQKVTYIDVDPNNSDSIVKGMNSLVKDIANEYVKDNSTGFSSLGGFLEQNGVSWFGSAIIWGAVFQFSLQTGIEDHDKKVNEALKAASHNSDGSMLGKPAAASISETLEGKWNDDIGWWMRAFIIGSKKYGCLKTTTGNVTYCKIARKTFEEVTEPTQLDPSKCGPGIYWSRNRKSAQGAFYKSTITNTVAVYSGAYLYSRSNYQPLLDMALTIEKWLTSSGLVDTNYNVYDGLDASLSCSVLNTTLWSYNAGTLIDAYVELIKANVNPQVYERNLDRLLATSLATFADEKNLPRERGCRGKEHPSKCNRDVSSYMAIFITSLANAYHITKNDELKNKINLVINTGLSEHLKSCSTKGCAAFYDLKPLGDGNKFNAYNNLSTLSFLLAKHSVMSTNGPPMVVDSNADKPRRSAALPTRTQPPLYPIIAIIVGLSYLMKYFN